MSFGRLVSMARELLDDPRATAAERSKHAARIARRFARNYPRSAVSGGFVSAGVAVSCLIYNASWARIFAVTGFVTALALLAGAVLASRWKGTPALIVWYNVAVGVIASACVGVATGLGGGFPSWGGIVLPIFWLYGTALLAARPKQQIVGILAQITAFTIPVLAIRSADGLGIFLIVASSAGAACLVSSLIREAADLRRFVDAYRRQHLLGEIERTNLELERVARQLARTVDDQLEGIVARRRDVQRLHRLLHVPDADRSQELSRALEVPRVPRAVDTEYPEGRVVGGRARVRRFIASGGFGDVYLAEDLASGDQVILKVMHTEGKPDPTRLKRFVLEAAAAATVRHPAIVRVYHVDVERSGAPFMICEHVEGETLRACAARGPIPLTIAVPIFEVIVDALSAVHRAGLVHRDIKPDNLMVGRSPPELRMLDFGVSRWVGEDFALTSAGEMIGSVGYMSPEQISKRRDLGPATDVFAVGMTLYECLAGQHPFTSVHPAAILQLLSCAEIPPIATKVDGLPESIASLVQSMLGLEPASRPDLDVVAAALREFREDHSCATLADAAGFLLGRRRAFLEKRTVPSDVPTVIQRDEE